MDASNRVVWMLLSDQKREKSTCKEELPTPTPHPQEGRVAQGKRAPRDARSGVGTPSLGTWFTKASPALPRGVCDGPPSGSPTNEPQL